MSTTATHDQPLAGLARHPFDAISFGLGLLVTLTGLSLVSAAADWATVRASWALPAGLVFVAVVLLVTTLRQAVGGRRVEGVPSELDDTAPDDTGPGDTARDDTALDDTALDDTAFEATAFDDTAFDDTAFDDAGLDETADAAVDDTAWDDAGRADTLDLGDRPLGPGSSTWPDEER